MGYNQSTMQLAIQRINSEEFGSLREEWNDLLSRSTSNSVFLRWEWIYTWWTIFSQSKTLFVLTAREGSRLVGIAPFYIDPSDRLGRRVLRFCSEELSPDYCDLILEKDQESTVSRALLESLGPASNQWDVMELDNLRADSILVTDPALFQRYPIHPQRSHQCPYIELSGTFEEYYQSRRKLRHFTLEKKLKTLHDRYAITLQNIQTEAHLAKGLQGLFYLHDKRTRSKNIQSNFLLSDTQRFHQAVSGHFLREGILNFQLLYDRETAISAFYAFNYNKKVNVFQITFDPDWSKWSPGAGLVYLAVQKAFKGGYKEFDFLKGTEPYKELWTTAIRDEMKLTVYNQTLRGHFFYALNKGASVLRRLRRATRSRMAPISARMKSR